MWQNILVRQEEVTNGEVYSKRVSLVCSIESLVGVIAMAITWDHNTTDDITDSAVIMYRVRRPNPLLYLPDQLSLKSILISRACQGCLLWKKRMHQFLPHHQCFLPPDNFHLLLSGNPHHLQPASNHLPPPGNHHLAPPTRPLTQREWEKQGIQQSPQHSGRRTAGRAASGKSNCHLLNMNLQQTWRHKCR